MQETTGPRRKAYVCMDFQEDAGDHRAAEESMRVYGLPGGKKKMHNATGPRRKACVCTDFQEERRRCIMPQGRGEVSERVLQGGLLETTRSRRKHACVCVRPGGCRRPQGRGGRRACMCSSRRKERVQETTRPRRSVSRCFRGKGHRRPRVRKERRMW